MYIFNFYNIIFACLIGIVCSSWFNIPNIDPIKSIITKDLKKKKASSKVKRYVLDVRSFGNECVINHENICEVANYDIHIKNGIKGHIAKVILAQKNTSDLVSVHSISGQFSDNGQLIFHFNDIPSLHYNIILEISDLIYNKDYDIGKSCQCTECNDNKRTIDLKEIKDNLIYKTKIQKENKIQYPYKTFVHGKYLFSKFLFFHSEINANTIENYNTLYNNYYELVYPCSGIIMTHSEKYNLNYDLSKASCYYIYLMDKFLKQINPSSTITLKFVSPVLLAFEEDKSNYDIKVTPNQSIQLPLKYKDSFYIPRDTVNGNLITINTHKYFNNNKYIYKNNDYNRMEQVHLFRMFFKLFSQQNNISNEEMLQYTTGLILEKPSTFQDKPYNIYAEELAVLLNSFNSKFNSESIGLKKNVVIMKEEQYISSYGSVSYAYINEDQLILRESSEICLIVLESIAYELSTYINKKLSDSKKNKCHIMRTSNSYANITTMYYTYELDCNHALYYREESVSQDHKANHFLTSISLLEDVSVKLIYDDIFEYSILFNVAVNIKSFNFLTRYIPNYINNNTIITFIVTGSKSDKIENEIEIKKFSYPMNCTNDCPNIEPIIIEDNFEYIAITTICIENNGLSTICIPGDRFSYVFDTRLLRVHKININPYPEVVLTGGVHTTITEDIYCIIVRQPNIVPNENFPVTYTDRTCKELINRCHLLTTAVIVDNVEISSEIKSIHNYSKLLFLTDFNEKHEEMLQITYSTKDFNNKKRYILTHYNNSFYFNKHDNKIHLKRPMEHFDSLPKSNYDNDEYDEFDKNDNSFKELKYNIEIKSYFESENKSTIHIQMPKNNDVSMYPFGQTYINYEYIKNSIHMKFLDNYIYFYDKKEINTNISQHFINISPYNYECLGAYAYLMNKFNILVNNSLNCEALNMIIEVLLKGKLGRYFINKENKIHLNFVKRYQGAYDVFDLVEVEIYAPNTPEVPIHKYKMNVSIDENNRNLLYSHKNMKYSNKYFSNIYILMFKIAYVFNDYDIYTFFNDLTGIFLIDRFTLRNLVKLELKDKTDIQNIVNLLKNEYQILIENHTKPSEELINEISLIAAYIVELTSSYKKNSINTYITSFAGIKYFVYVDEFLYKNKEYKINDMAYKLSKYNTLIIKKKALCCSNFVDEIEKSLKYYIIYKYIVTDRIVQESEIQIISIANNVIQKLLEHPILSTDVCIPDENKSNKIIATIMEGSGYISRTTQLTYVDMECIDLDVIDHYENIIEKFITFGDSNGMFVEMYVNSSILGNSITIKEDMDYQIYFLFRNLSMPFVGKSNRKESSGLRRFLLKKGTVFQENEKTSISCYLDIVNKDSIFMLEKIIFVSKEGDRLVKEVNVEYQTFFVHPMNLITEAYLDIPKIIVKENYYSNVVECSHYSNGLESCIYPAYGYENINPFYVSYLENNQRKDILFSNNDELKKINKNSVISISRRYNIEIKGDIMIDDIYDTIRAIFHEITGSMGIYDFSKKSCGPLYLNNNQLNLVNDPNSLISNILYDTKYCIDRNSIFNKILEICNFDKKELASLFGGIRSHILPYTLNEEFANSLTQNELINLIFYFISSPPQLIEDVKMKPLYLEILELTDNPNMKVIVEENFIKINKNLLSKVHKFYIVEFNTILYEQLLNWIPDESKNKEFILRESNTNNKNVLETINYYMNRYINKNSCSDSVFTNNGSLFNAFESPTYQYPSFTYKNNDIYLKQQINGDISFNNLFLYEGRNYLNDTYINAILVLSPNRFPALNQVTFIELVANSLDNNNQIVLKCHPRKDYDKSVVQNYNLEKGTIYFVCKNIYIKYLKNGFYEFNKYLVYYEKDGQITHQQYENMPVKPIYEVKTLLQNVPNQKPSITIQRANKNQDSNIEEYLIHIKGQLKLHRDPYSVIKPAFTQRSYLLNTNIHIFDDYVAYKHFRNLKNSEYLNIPLSKYIFKGESLSISLVQSKKKNDIIDNVYSLKINKSNNLLGLIIMDIHGNKYNIEVTEGEVVSDNENINRSGSMQPTSVENDASNDNGQELDTTPNENVHSGSNAQINEKTQIETLIDIDRPIERTLSENGEQEEERKLEVLVGEVPNLNSQISSDNGAKIQTNYNSYISLKIYLLEIEKNNNNLSPEWTGPFYFKVSTYYWLGEGIVALSVFKNNEPIMNTITEEFINMNALNDMYKQISSQIQINEGNYTITIRGTIYNFSDILQGSNEEIKVERVYGESLTYLQNKINEKKGSKSNLKFKNTLKKTDPIYIPVTFDTKKIMYQPSQIKPVEVRPAEVRPAEVGPAEVRPAEVGPAEVRPAEVRPAEVRPAGTNLNTVIQSTNTNYNDTKISKYYVDLPTENGIITYKKNLYYPHSLKSLDENSSDDSVFEGLISLVENLQVSKYIVEVNNNYYTEQCVSGNCYVIPDDIKRIMKSFRSNIVNGKYELDIQKHINLSIENEDGTPEERKTIVNKGDLWINIQIYNTSNMNNIVLLENFTLQNYYIKEGIFNITCTNGEYRINNITTEDNSTISSEIKKVMKILGYELLDGDYAIYIEAATIKPLMYNNKKEYEQYESIINNILQIQEFKYSFKAVVHVLNDGNNNSYYFKKVVEGHFEDTKEGEYSIDVINEIYNITPMYGAILSEEKGKYIIHNTWDLKEDILINFNIKIFTKENMSEYHKRIDGEEYYLTIKKLSDQENMNYGTEHITFIGNTIGDGSYFVKVFNNIYTSNVASGLKLDSNIIKNLMLLSYEQIKNGDYFISIRKKYVKDNNIISLDIDKNTVTKVSAKCLYSYTDVSKDYILMNEPEKNIDEGVFELIKNLDGSGFTFVNKSKEVALKDITVTTLKKLLDTLPCSIYNVSIKANINKDSLYTHDVLQQGDIPYTTLRQARNTSYGTSQEYPVAHGNFYSYNANDMNRTTAYYKKDEGYTTIKTTLCSTPVKSKCKNLLRRNKREFLY
ncbi:oocyst capsule protein, putative [Plasmodium relictum]|uniref:Oocyst capsule protein, putative n=1 Tax=Plasmodium relictum TaxID=85471 RepID=A0A1J1H4B3_PLARL|nr:oocyst capsule protein, putative [Plasmodium relictum]CRG99751.1 oocyst capsule protein, putative [Plasmodium relictum]